MTDSNIKPSVVLPRHVFPILQSGAARRILSAQIYGGKTKVTKVEDLQTCAWLCNMLWTVVSLTGCSQPRTQTGGEPWVKLSHLDGNRGGGV